MNYNGSAADMKTILDFPPCVLSQNSRDGYRNSLPQMRQIFFVSTDNVLYVVPEKTAYV